ncbi:hypothetical protein Scep_017876 [Stephania cephalantha]|uniref:Uncharacterized protein n=1 Tax=Stephania cephalantha TaxID=152367 RepID=A0AAP0NUN6_9MAGN
MTPPKSRQAEDEGALSVSDQRTIYLVNTFILDTSRFLSRFALLSEQKLSQVHRRIVQLEESLALLEEQLSSFNQ